MSRPSGTADGANPDSTSPFFQANAIRRIRVEEPLAGFDRHSLTFWLLVSLTAGGTGGAIAILITTGFKSDDVFAFAGAIIGAAATVAGAAWLADHTVNKAKRAEQEAILDEIHLVRQRVAVTLPFFPDTYEVRDGCFEALELFEPIALHANEFFIEVIQHAKTLDFGKRQKIKALSRALEEFLAFHERDKKWHAHAPGSPEFHELLTKLADASRDAGVSCAR